MNTLTSREDTLKDILEDWKEKLKTLRTSHYFLSYVPNKMLSILVNYFKTKEARYEVGVLCILQFINKSITVEDIRAPELEWNYYGDELI